MAINVGPQPPTTATPIDMETQNAPDNTQLVTPPPPDQPQIRNVPVPFVPPHVGRLAQIGHAASQLLGQSYDYRVNPQTGQTEQVAVKQKPGDLFRHMVAGALMGGAAAEGGHSVLEGVARGGTASIAEQQRQDVVRRGQAEQQFKNQLAASEEQRKQAEFQTQQQLTQAQIAHMNAATAHENMLIQGESFKMHEDMANFGKAQMQPFLDAGVKPVYRDVSETDMHDLQKNAPGAQNLYWEPTGVKHGIKPDGSPTYELTYTAVNPTSKVKLTKQTLDAWNKAGLQEYDPQVGEIAKPGYEMDARDFMTVNNRAQALYNTKLQNLKVVAETEEATNRGKQALAAAAKDYAERDNYIEGKTKAGAFNKALATLNKVGSFDKLEAGDKLILSESGQKAADSAMAKYKIDKANFDDTAAAEDLKDWEFYNGLVKSALGGKSTVESTPLPEGGGKPLTDLAIGALFLKEAGGNKEKAAELAKKHGWLPPTSATAPTPPGGIWGTDALTKRLQQQGYVK